MITIDELSKIKNEHDEFVQDAKNFISEIMFVEFLSNLRNPEHEVVILDDAESMIKQFEENNGEKLKYGIKLRPEEKKVIREIYIIQDQLPFFHDVAVMLENETYTYKRFRQMLKDKSRYIKQVEDIIEQFNDENSYESDVDSESEYEYDSD